MGRAPSQARQSSGRVRAETAGGGVPEGDNSRAREAARELNLHSRCPAGPQAADALQDCWGVLGGRVACLKEVRVISIRVQVSRVNRMRVQRGTIINMVGGCLEGSHGCRQQAAKGTVARAKALQRVPVKGLPLPPCCTATRSTAVAPARLPTQPGISCRISLSHNPLSPASPAGYPSPATRPVAAPPCAAAAALPLRRCCCCRQRQRGARGVLGGRWARHRSPPAGTSPPAHLMDRAAAEYLNDGGSL